jgi:hypothetical protein
MLSLGRQEEFDDFNQIALSDERAEMDRLNYMGVDVSCPLNCNACHFNGGANTDPNFDFASTGVSSHAFESTNRSFAPRVEGLINQPGDVVYGEDQPFDDVLMVLNQANLHFADAVPLFEKAKRQLRSWRYSKAKTTLQDARDIMIDRSAVVN